KREYENVIPPELYHELVYGRYRVDTRDLELSESFFTALLDDLVGLAKKVKKVEEIAPLTYKVIRDLRGFVNWLAYTIEPMIRDCYLEPKGGSRACSDQLIEELEKMKKEKGYSPTPEQLAKEMAYVFMNKLVFYKILERYWGKLPRLKPLLSQGVKSSTEYLDKLNSYFMRAIEVTENFEPIFVTGIYDLITLPDDPEVLRGIDEFITYLERLSIEKFSDIIGYVYEELIPAEERHILGEFYTPPPIAELIVKWCIRSPNDIVLDPGCGSGTFLVQAYKQLYYLKTGKKLEKIRYPEKQIHEKILEQLYAIDINEFPAHLTAINLAMRNPRAPSTKMNVAVSDFFLVAPCQRLLLPYRTRILGSEKESKIIHIPKVDCVVGNPPYTKWTKIPRPTQDRILEGYRDQMARYGLVPQIGRGVEPCIYIYWIMHAKEFLKDGGRLGMIISDSWLQTDYGVKFGKFLLDNFKVRAIIDFSARVFPVPLIGTCIILLERCTNPKLRDENNVVFMYLRVEDEKIDIDQILDMVNTISKSGVPQSRVEKNCIVKVVRQKELREKNVKWINFVFAPEELIQLLKKSKLVTPLTSIFEPCRGNTYWSYWALKHGHRPDVGGEKFFYLSISDVQRYRIPSEYLHPLIPSARYLKFFTFGKEDWETLKRNNVKCYLFLAHKPRHLLPDAVRKYVMLGEGANAQIRLRRRRGEKVGKPVSESVASQTRKKYKQYFYDWYDLGGVLKTPIYCTYGAQYWIRFALANFKCALDHRILALIPKQDVRLSELELKALLAYLNSSFSQLQAEVYGRSTGGGMIELDVKPLSRFLVLDVKKLHEEQIKRLAELFDRLENEARRLGRADAVENVFGSELARELTGKEVRPGVKGLWNTVIKEIDYEIAKILGLEEIVENLRTILLELVKRRLARAREAKPETLKGSEELLIIREEKKKEFRGKVADSKNLKLDIFLKTSKKK
ncbi:MAG TPA: hypothetical protein EYH26_00340, partial [Pyrodictium sp.]|nr:hypothetical protein [Pyrodictium sp.]